MIAFTDREFEALSEYSCSNPTGVIEGKRWRRRQPYGAKPEDAVWFLREYVAAGPDHCAITECVVVPHPYGGWVTLDSLTWQVIRDCAGPRGVFVDPSREVAVTFDGAIVIARTWDAFAGCSRRHPGVRVSCTDPDMVLRELRLLDHVGPRPARAEETTKEGEKT